jgi:hypothetical protein
MEAFGMDLPPAKVCVPPDWLIRGVGVITKANMDEPSYKGLLQPKERKLTPFVGD